MTDTLVGRDLKHVWHPCTQMKDYEQYPPLAVAQAQGCYLQLINGQPVIDAISSWWCKSLGHGNERIKEALIRQANHLEHTLIADITHETLVKLSEKLCSLTPHLNKVLYASDGSCAVEIAAKMALHAQQLRGQPQRTQFLALENAYHGETMLALSLSDLGLFKEPYQSILLPTHFIKTIPYVNTPQDPKWDNCEKAWSLIESQLEPLKNTLCALIVEPIVQGSCGMKIYSQDFLKRLATWAKENHIYLIADEIMTGLGRTGKMLACEYAKIYPDFLCLAKGLTAGWLPMSATLTTDEIFNLFYDDYHTGKIFIHSHTHSGNALAAAVALETLEIIEEENLCKKVEQLHAKLFQAMNDVAQTTKKLQNVRGIGGIIAADLMTRPGKRAGFHVYQEALKLGALLRPLGNTLYWLPPFIIDDKTIGNLQEITCQAILNQVDCL